MQQKPVVPSDPTRPPEGEPEVPAPARSTAIPELGVADDPGLGPGLVQARVEPEGTPATPEGRSTEFVAVEGGKETASAATLLVTAYILMWVLLLGFLLLSWRRQRGIEARIAELESALARADRSDGEKPDA